MTVIPEKPSRAAKQLWHQRQINTATPNAQPPSQPTANPHTFSLTHSDFHSFILIISSVQPVGALDI
jgi:hypothetical protein